MEAIVVQEFGPPAVLVQATVEDPGVGPGQAVIESAFASITFVETQIRAGRAPNPAMLPELPYVPGNGVGGTVVSVGPGGDRDLVGATVVSSTGGSGGYAQLATADAVGLTIVPDHMDLADAVALLADGRTAMALAEAAEIASGDTVLVEAAAGGVGTLLVQLARSRGARVVAAASTVGKLELAEELGAEVLIDYSDPAWVDAARFEAGDFDVVFDGVGGDVGEAAFDLLHRGGRFCTFGLASGTFAQIPAGVAAERGVRVVRGAGVTPETSLEFTRAAIAEAAEGRLRPVIGQTFPLEDAAGAHAAIERRASIGKTLLTVGG